MEKALIGRLFKRGRRKQTPFFTVYRLKTNPPPQIAVVVSLRVSKLATERNLIKRRLREAFRRLTPKLEPGLKIAVVVAPPAVRKSYKELEDALRSGLDL